MSQSLAKKSRNNAFKVVVFQVILAVLIGLIGLAFSTKVALSLIIGASIVIIANSVFIMVFFRKSGAQATVAVHKGLMVGESLKLLLTIVLLILAFKFLAVHIQPPAVLIGFAIIVLSQWLAPLLVKQS